MLQGLRARSRRTNGDGLRFRNRTVNYDLVDKYAQLLKQKNVQGVLVNSASGEGTTLRVEERKRMAEEWLKAARKYQLNIMVHIGSTNIAEVYEMAEHSEKIGVDAILVLPELLFRPRTEEDLVEYLRDISKYAPTRPLFYYHIPELTQVRCKYSLEVWLDEPVTNLPRSFSVLVSMVRLWDLVERDVQTFAGILYAHHDLDEATALWKRNRYVILWADNILNAALSLGFEAFTSTVMNVLPERFIEVIENHRSNKLPEAMMAQEKFSKQIYDIYRRGSDWIQVWKQEFNKVHFKLGALRKPQFNVINREY